MLHAELAGKVTPDADDITRREDVLTSTVFGTLFLANAWSEVMLWMRRAHPVGHTSALVPPENAVDGAYWFWPRLHGAEPDVVFRCGSLLVVVEAKYLSGKSGSGVLDGSKDVESTDQLLREWRACSRGVDTSGYPRDLCDAIDVCELALVYLVRRARRARELRAIEDSVSQVDGTRMYLLTWEDLDDVLARHEARWARELRAYLHRRYVAAFRGFETAMRVPSSALAWRYRPASSRRGLRDALTAAHQEAATRLTASPLRFRRAAPAMAWARALSIVDRELLGRLVTRESTFLSSEESDG